MKRGICLLCTYLPMEEISIGLRIIGLVRLSLRGLLPPPTYVHIYMYICTHICVYEYLLREFPSLRMCHCSSSTAKKPTLSHVSSVQCPVSTKPDLTPKKRKGNHGSLAPVKHQTRIPEIWPLMMIYDFPNMIRFIRLIRLTCE